MIDTLKIKQIEAEYPCVKFVEHGKKVKKDGIETTVEKYYMIFYTGVFGQGAFIGTVYDEDYAMDHNKIQLAPDLEELTGLHGTRGARLQRSIEGLMNKNAWKTATNYPNKLTLPEVVKKYIVDPLKSKVQHRRPQEVGMITP